MDVLFAPEGEKKKGLLAFLWIAYALATALLISNHAPWTDEAYAWLAAREVSWLGIYREATRHSALSLWYYVLAVPAKLGFPYWTMQLLHWLVACFAIGIFLFKSPFSLLFKAAFIFSYYIAYEHAVIARVYMPTLLLMWSACWCYGMRGQRPVLYGFIVFLLANTSLYGLLAAVFLGGEFLATHRGNVTKKRLWALAGMALGILAGVLTFVPTVDWASGYINNSNFFYPERVRDIFYFSYLAPLACRYFSKELAASLWVLVPWLGALYFVLTLWLLKRWKAYGLMVFLVFGWLAIIYLMVFKYPWGHPRHYSFCLMYTVMVLWLGRTQYRMERVTVEPWLGGLFVAAFALSVWGTLAQGERDTQLPFSGSRLMAKYLIEHKLDDKIFVVQQNERPSSILPYIPKASLWDPVEKRIFRCHYYLGTYSTPGLTLSNALARIDRYFVSSGPVYLISVLRPDRKAIGRLKLLYTAQGQKETLRLYEVIRSAQTYRGR